VSRVVGMIVVMIVVMIVRNHGKRSDGGRGPSLAPERCRANEREAQEGEAAQRDEEVKLFAQEQIEHLRLPEIESQANDAECPRKPNHTELVDEVGIVFMVVMIVCHR